MDKTKLAEKDANQAPMTNNSTEESKDDSRSTNASQFIQFSDAMMNSLEKDILFAVLNLQNNLVGDQEVGGQANIHAQVNKLTNEIVAKILATKKEVVMSASKIMNKMDEQHQEVMSELN